MRSWPPFRLDPLFDYQLPVSTALGTPIFWPQLGPGPGHRDASPGVVAVVRTRGVVRGVGDLGDAAGARRLPDAAPAARPALRPGPAAGVRAVPVAPAGRWSASARRSWPAVLVEALSARAAIRAVFAGGDRRGIAGDGAGTPRSRAAADRRAHAVRRDDHPRPSLPTTASGRPTAASTYPSAAASGTRRASGRRCSTLAAGRPASRIGAEQPPDRARSTGGRTGSART